MHTVILVMIVLEGNQIAQVVEIPARYETMAVCEESAKKHLAMPLPYGRRDLAVCVDPLHDELLVMQ